MNDYKSVFIDNDKPELIEGFPKIIPTPTPVPPSPYYPDQHRPVPPPEYVRPEFPPRYPERVINPTPTVKHCPPPPPPMPHCPDPHHLYPRRPLEWREDGMYVTKHELNRILHNIAEADIFTDLTTTGTTVSLGGITKGTKLSKITFAQLVDKLLYPKDGTEGAYVTQGELEEALKEIDYADILNKPTEFDFKYPAKDTSGQTTRNYIVTNEVGGFKVNDSLEGMTIVDILEKLLCGENNPWGSYIWKSSVVSVASPMTNGISDETFLSNFTAEIAGKTPDEVEALLETGHYYLYSPCSVDDIDNKSDWKYKTVIAYDKAAQSTYTEDDNVSASVMWHYDYTNKKITFSDTSFGFMNDRYFVLIKR